MLDRVVNHTDLEKSFKDLNVVYSILFMEG